jgi:predicted GNAT family N-acyltransferase
MTKKRKSPVRHNVKSHVREQRPVRAYSRGSGNPKLRIVKKKFTSKLTKEKQFKLFEKEKRKNDTKETWKLFVSGKEAGIVTIILPKNKDLPVALNYIVTYPKFRKEGLGKFLLNRIELITKSKGYKKIEVKSTEEAKSFYKSHGYIFEKRIDFDEGSPLFKFSKILN